jgi:hypothetical protein
MDAFRMQPDESVCRWIGMIVRLKKLSKSGAPVFWKWPRDITGSIKSE